MMDVRMATASDTKTAEPRLSACFAPLARAVLLAAAVLLGLAAPGAPARAAPDGAQAGKPLTICEDQTYALCASARCTMLNGVAYCRCEVERGDSISLSLRFRGQDACSVNAQGARNGFMVSTFSLPPEVVRPGGDKAVYDCEAATATGAYAQCDGGLCFQSTRGQRFPGFAEPLTGNEIICACPTVTANPETAKIGYQIIGPYPCQQDFFAFCRSGTANTDNGSSIYVGAPTGTPRFLTRKLDGSVPPLNRCLPGR